MPLANEQIGQTFLGGAEFFFSGRTIGEVAVSSEIEIAEAVDSHKYNKVSEVPALENSTGETSVIHARSSSNALVETDEGTTSHTSKTVSSVAETATATDGNKSARKSASSIVEQD